ncbi:MAG: alpha/beta hydrolase family esterase [Acidimicrobiia bacterium]
MRRWLASILLIGVAAFGFGTEASPPAAGEGTDPTAARPYGLKVPEGYDAGRPVPLVVLLHGYSSNGSAQNSYFRLSAQADRGGFLLAYPNGTRDLMGNRFWNATDACCDFYARGVDDVGYLDAVIDEISRRYAVDPARVFLVGHSNGAFMAHRYACDRAGRVAAIVALAGMQWQDPGRCGASSPVSVLHVHGRNDETIHYEGGSTPKGAYPGAVDTTGTWAAKNGCSGSLTSSGRRLDLDSSVSGDETTVDRYQGCPGVDIELWTIEGGGHVPAFNGRWAEAIWEFMAAHPRAGPPAAG